jgi:DNA-binding LacI/PurR family transcriptional regulator
MPMTIAQVARRAGVSTATVSRAFNSPQLLAGATLERVRDSARALGFVPNASARTLRTQRSRILGVVLPTLRNPVFAECLEGIAARAGEAGYAIVPLFTDYTGARERDAIAHLLARDVDGVILTVASAARCASLKRLRAASLPYVLAYNRHPAQPCVSVDGEAACAQATARLLALGHRRIAMVSGTLAASDRARQRHRGYASAMAAAALARAELIEVPFLEDATDALAARLTRADRPSALLCSNDLLALRSLRAATLAGLRVPDQLSIVGFDGIALGDAIAPRLSTIVQPSGAMGEACVDWLVRSLGAGALPRPADSISLPYTLREGETCAPPARDASRRIAARPPDRSGSTPKPTRSASRNRPPERSLA